MTIALVNPRSFNFALTGVLGAGDALQSVFGSGSMRIPEQALGGGIFGDDLWCEDYPATRLKELELTGQWRVNGEACNVHGWLNRIP